LFSKKSERAGRLSSKAARRRAILNKSLILRSRVLYYRPVPRPLPLLICVIRCSPPSPHYSSTVTSPLVRYLSPESPALTTFSDIHRVTRPDHTRPSRTLTNELALLPSHTAPATPTHVCHSMAPPVYSQFPRVYQRTSPYAPTLTTFSDIHARHTPRSRTPITPSPQPCSHTDIPFHAGLAPSGEMPCQSGAPLSPFHFSIVASLPRRHHCSIVASLPNLCGAQPPNCGTTSTTTNIRPLNDMENVLPVGLRKVSGG